MSKQALEEELLGYLADLLDVADDGEESSHAPLDCLILAARGYQFGLPAADVAGLERVTTEGRHLSDLLELLKLDTGRICTADAGLLTVVDERGQCSSDTEGCGETRQENASSRSRPLIRLTGGPWALVCDRIVGVEKLDPGAIRRRISRQGTLPRPWLAGLYGEHPIILLEAPELIAMMAASLRSLAADH